MDEVHMNCSAKNMGPLMEFEQFQGELKVLEPEDYEKFKSRLLRHGFCEPLTIWVHEKKKFILNGHQRVLTLKKMDAEGYRVPGQLPWNEVNLKNKKEAKEVLLSMASNYGKMTEDGLRAYCEEAGLKLTDMIGEFRFPELEGMLTEWNSDIDSLDKVEAENVSAVEVIRITCEMGHAEEIRGKIKEILKNYTGAKVD